MNTARLSVRLVATTHFEQPDDIPWSTDADGGQALVEFAGRACYQSWSKPNPRTATNGGYLAHLLAVGNLSVLEHANVSFYITGISRSCSHELIRHRHFSFSQLSQRSVMLADGQSDNRAAKRSNDQATPLTVGVVGPERRMRHTRACACTAHQLR